jgi:beta-lactam-binding protein with PASTA domain
MPSEEPVVACLTMPNFTGMDLQSAQDKVQADLGIWYSDSHEVGGDRMQIIDSNWIVVSQTPAPGTCVSEDTAIDFGVKSKY